MKNKFYSFTIISFALSICIGLFLRYQISGIVSAFEQFDLRRVHTHIGFYLFLFPMVWLTFKPNAWRPSSGLLLSYSLVSSLALISFFFFGYSTSSKVFSGLVLVYWIAYSVLNLKMTEKTWRHPFYGILLATAFIGTVIYFGSQGKGELVARAVRAFMTSLVWGTFIPLALEKRNYPQPNMWVWLIGVFLTSLFVMNIDALPLVFFGPILVACSLFYLLYLKKNRASRLDFYWLISAIGLLFLGLGIIDNTFYIAIGGIHLVILGPILQSVFNFKALRWPWIYDASLLVMVAAICAPVWLPMYYNTTQLITVVSSTMLVSWLLISVTTIYRKGL